MTGEWDPVLIPILIDAIAVLGLYVIANSGRLSAGHAAYVGIGAYAAGRLALDMQLPLWVLLLAGVVAAGLVGGLFATIAEPLQSWFFAVATLAAGVVAAAVIANIDGLGGPLGLYGGAVEVGLGTVVVALVVSLVVVVGYDRSRWGKESLAVREDSTAAQALGISVRTVHLRAFVLGCALAGLAGALRVNYIGFAQPADLSFERSLLLLVYLTVGGSTHIPGALIGTISLGLLPEVLRFVGEYRLEFFGALVVLVMIFRPQGLVPEPRVIAAGWHRLIGLFGKDGPDRRSGPGDGGGASRTARSQQPTGGAK